MRHFVAAALLLGLAAPAPSRAQALMSEEERTLYALGLVAASSFQDLDLSARERELVRRGLDDFLSGRKTQVRMADYERKVQEFTRKRLATAADARKEKQKSAVADAAREKGAVKTASGLVYVPIAEGRGASPSATDVVRVHYEGKLTDGRVFDSSLRHQPAEFPLNAVIPCWTEGLQKMKVGGTAKLVCPPSLAYGDQGRPPAIPGGATLIFQVQLLDIAKK